MIKKNSFPVFEVSRGVRKRRGDEFDDHDRDFVGWSRGVYDTGNSNINFTVGRYGFNNSISATIFSYLNQQNDIPLEYAKEAIVRFEENLRSVGKLDKIARHTRGVDLAAGMISHPIKKVLDAAAACADFAGGIYLKTKKDIDAGHYNWCPPTSSTGAKNYAAYALGFWHENPHVGPAYILGRQAGKNQKSTTGKEFNPFGWK